MPSIDIGTSRAKMAWWDESGQIDAIPLEGESSWPLLRIGTNGTVCEGAPVRSQPLSGSFAIAWPMIPCMSCLNGLRGQTCDQSSDGLDAP